MSIIFLVAKSHKKENEGDQEQKFIFQRKDPWTKLQRRKLLRTTEFSAFARFVRNSAGGSEGWLTT